LACAILKSSLNKFSKKVKSNFQTDQRALFHAANSNNSTDVVLLAAFPHTMPSHFHHRYGIVGVGNKTSLPAAEAAGVLAFLINTNEKKVRD